ncbi:hypothetical protein COT87_02910 [Candidatus Collierbacteria bacterium CG10_big_fil_rev_8_21_14_0_10_44_9]|uniref:Uncharacterized protein n=1 Tax=Candidatus Collierbacteria bacterium CG10_big_fil_rev_8_21_14_0_10_44_9 TaxID=1974535 RepID=A0A2H0VI81_9BACT|nr:MAG: hypothetical protein COT87_02910 [Candidatus Collierbacteria bacterium CG10_big_fil_rev_8_21_14_0_10_44_9]
MKLPAFFGHKRSINLLPRDAFENSALGIILEWSLVFGKWSVILTQLIVMGAFLYRFTLDRSLTYLRKSIDRNVAVIKSFEQIERDFVLTQKQVAQAKIALDSQNILLRSQSGMFSSGLSACGTNCRSISCVVFNRQTSISKSVCEFMVAGRCFERFFRNWIELTKLDVLIRKPFGDQIKLTI